MFSKESPSAPSGQLCRAAHVVIILIPLSVAASASSHSGGKMVLLVAIIKTGRG